ncbi:ATP-dependent helicase HrpB [Gulosibacter sp. 10]|uniref:ATP-dependent helicase HrpB n=1 Tax=Gulosibacter sp. 10 TaxID=1255570 RepID=UPI0020CC67BE|nr:ATP-dependent helicase HrpB [Gulosibacter sp. 10]
MFDLEAIAAGLPAARLIPDLDRAVRDRGRAVVEAPPGSGKTTIVPPAVANARGRVLVAQPRRIAARAAASRLAALAGTRVGEAVGYSIRGERRAGPATRIEFVTSGILLRRLLRDPELPGVDAVVLDEVHERHLDTDLAAAMLAEVGTLREDLAILAMSATLDAGRWASLLGRAAGEAAPVVRAPAAPHPLEIRWAPFAGARLDRRGVSREFLAHVARTAAGAMRASDSGSVLVFLPGGYEVDAVVRELRALGVDALPLTGSLSSAEQDAALAPGPRRAIVATSVAESSLTVPDVRLVVDSGLARVPRLDVERNISGLVTESVSQASGDQRAGRAARLGPGIAIRCAAEHEWAGFPREARPEMLSGDLTAAALALAVWGAPGGRGMALPDAPEPRALALAHETLRSLGAIELDGERVAVTARGRRLAEVPAHPRLARALLDGAERLGPRRAGELVAAIESAERAPGADLAAALRRLRDGSSREARRWRRDADRLAGIAGAAGGRPAPPSSDDTALGVIAALAYPERLARARGEGSEDYLLAGGTGASLPRDAALRGQPWLAIADLGRRPSGGAVIRAAAPIDPDLAIELAGPLLEERVETRWRDGKARARRIRRLGAIELSAAPVAPSPAQARAALAEALARDGLSMLPWPPAAVQLRNRLALLRGELGEPWPDVSDAGLRKRLEEWLGPELDAVSRGAPLGRVDVLGALRRLLPWPEAARLDELAPERIEVPSGSRIRVDYPDPGTERPRPVLRVKLQECFGWLRTPRLVDGRVPLLLQLLSPAGRPVAITDDLESFWAGPYAQVRAEMRGRYPKHPWPEDPLAAEPRRGVKRPAR